MPNPLIEQGELNRLVASVLFPDNPNLNVTAAFLGKAAIRLALEGNATDYINTLTGAVASRAPYMPATVTIHLLKTQILSSLYKAQMEVNSRVGDIAVFPDVPLGSGGLEPYHILNCSIQNVRELSFDGMDAEWQATIAGYYNINAAMWG